MLKVDMNRKQPVFIPHIHSNMNKHKYIQQSKTSPLSPVNTRALTYGECSLSYSHIGWHGFMTNLHLKDSGFR